MGKLAVAAVLCTFAAAAIGADNQPGRYSVTIDPSNPKSVWRLDTSTGAISRCETPNLDFVPTCTPWSNTGADGPLYSYDPATRLIVPANEAARQRTVNRPACLQLDDKGRPPLDCFVR